MNYILRNHEVFPAGGRQQFEVSLWKNDLMVFSMIYDVSLQTARVQSCGAKRVFMVYNKGRRQPKTIFVNEYGLEVGMINETLDTEGYCRVIMYEKEHFFHLPENTGGILSMSDYLGGTAIMNIRTEMRTKDAFTDEAANVIVLKYFYCVLMGICWYLSVDKKETSDVSSLSIPSSFGMLASAE